MSVTLETGGACGPVEMRKALAEIGTLLPWNEFTPTGSVYTNGAGNDCDVLVLGSFADRQTLELAGFTVCCDTEYGDATSSEWVALRRGDVNVLLCFTSGLYARWKSAAEVCRWLAPTTKQQRIILHEIIKNLASMEVAFERATTC